MNRHPALLRALFTLGTLALAPSLALAQESGDSGDLAAKAVVTSGAQSGQSDAMGAKAPEPAVQQGESDGPMAAATADGDDAPSWSGKSANRGLSDTQPVASKDMNDGDGDSRGSEADLAGADRGGDVVLGAKSTAGGAGDDSGPRRSG